MNFGGLQDAFKALGTKYRQSVLNDFSIVSKAKFYIFEKKMHDVFNYKKVLPVQINPHNISQSSTKPEISNGSGLANRLRQSQGISSVDSDTLDLELIYDIYDEYMVRTCDGLISGVSNVASGKDFTEMSLKNENATSLVELMKCASQQDDYNSADIFVLFKWGSLEFFGKITSLSCRYEVFSRWGEPLKANVNVTMTQIGDNKGLNNLSSIAGTTVKTIEKAEMGFNTIALGMSTVLRS